MARFTVCWVETILLLFLLHVMLCSSKSNSRRSFSNDRHNVLLPEKVKLVLGLPDVSSIDSSKQYREGVSKYAPDKPPRYMRELYQVYRHGSENAERTTGNTVRSIHADIGDVNGGHMFVFNLSSVGRQETIISAEIHIFRKKSKGNKRRQDPEMLVYEVAPQYMTLTKQISLHKSSRGWHSVEVTQSVRSSLSSRRVQPHLLALTFEAENNNGRASLLSLKKFINRHSLPFLIVFSNDTQNNITLDHLDPYYGKPHKVRKPVSPKGPPSILPLSHPSFFHGTDFTLEELGLATGGKTLKKNPKVDTERTTPKQNMSEGEEIVDNKTGTSESLGENDPIDTENETDTDLVMRKKRSMMDNKIPEEPFDFSTLNFNIPQTHPSILISRKESRQKLSNSKLIPFPGASKKNRRGKNQRSRKRNKKNKRRRKKQNKQSLPFPQEWGIEDNKATILKDNTLCGRKRLVVNFADIGWGEWIISPTSFEAHYCAGSCPFPLTKNLRPSNHATIQSIINVIGIRPEVPAPCCVPESMSSVTLLYFDENKNVVLKNYPHMSVESCSCR